MTPHEPDEPQDVIRWLLSAGGDNTSISRKPLGQRDAVINLLAESLPRPTVDDGGCGTIKRGRAELAVQLVGDPVRVIELTLRPEHVTAFRPQLERIATKAGWQLVDPDRGEILFPLPVEASSGSAGRWAAAAMLIVAAVGGGAWWMSRGPAGGTSTPAQMRSQRGAGGPAAGSDPRSAGTTARDGTSPAGVPTITPEEFMAQAQEAATIMKRQRSLAPAFRGMRVVNDLLVVAQAEWQFGATIGNGLYVDPVVLADPSKSPAGMDPALPPQYASPVRGDYRFSFTGTREGQPFFDNLRPAYHSFAYVATPALGAANQYTFALLSETGRVHYTTDGRIPAATDPSVTDSVAVEAPAVITDIERQKNETGLMASLRAFINGFFHSKPVQDAQLGYHEDRAIRDLRAFSAAQTALFATIGGQGYGSPEALSEPSILPGAPPIPPFLDRSFTQEVREGYRFNFAGQNPASGSGTGALYGDYTYTATPVGSVPPGRRSFAIFSDGVIRFRIDGAPPQKSDPMLGSEK